MIEHPPTNLLMESFRADRPLVPPRFAMFNVIRRCNAGCAYCADWKNDPDPRTDPDRRDIVRILDGLAALGVGLVQFTGGEPFLRRDLHDLMSHARRSGMEVGTISNGTAITEDRARALFELQPAMVGVSIDSTDALRMRRIRGLEVRRVLDTIAMLARVATGHGLEQVVSMLVTITRVNVPDLLSLADHARELGVAISYQPVHFAGSGTPQQVLDAMWPGPAEIDALEDICQQLIVRKQAGDRIQNRPEFLAQIPGFFARRTFYPGDACTVAYTDIVIDTDFGVRPCWPMEPVAHLDERTRIEDVWFSSAMQDARARIREKNCPGCLYACHLNKPHTDLPALSAPR
jgi:MoaA/NifB/PqqE/SkfB family radical SAM enzyme